MRLPAISSIVVSAFAVALVAPAAHAASYECPSGINATNSKVLDNVCYAYYSTGKSWSQAETACQALGGHLVAIRSALIDAAIAEIAPAEVWIGAADNNSLVAGSSEGNFFWAGDATSFWTGGLSGVATDNRYTNWNTNEPNDFGSNEDCVVKYSYQTWNDYVCGNSRAYVCGIPGVDPSSSSSTAGSTRAGGLRSQSLQMRIEQASKKLNAKSTSKSSSAKTKKGGK